LASPWMPWEMNGSVWVAWWAIVDVDSNNWSLGLIRGSSVPISASASIWGWRRSPVVRWQRPSVRWTAS
jgi:hypothetical protein